jgi:hypothetical protein
MKTLSLFLVALLSCFLLTAQPAAPGPGNFLLIDTAYTVGTSVANQTITTISYQNSTATKTTGLQFRVFYDKIAFKSPTVSLVNANSNLNLQYTTDTTNGNITISLVYIGNSSSFSLPTGKMFSITYNHAPAATFQYLTSIDSMRFTGTQPFTAWASSQSGNDTTVTLYSWGGAFSRPMMEFHGRFVNVTGTSTRNITVSLEKQPKAGGSWVLLDTKTSDTAGKYVFNDIVDTTYWNTRIEVKGDTMSLGNTISIADAQKVNRIVLGLDTAKAFDFYSSDVNGDNKISISDAYVIYGRIAGRFSSWVNNVQDVKFFTTSEHATITGTPLTNFTSTITGTTNVIYSITGGGSDSITYYVLGKGDANGTGFKMAKVTPIQIINPNNNNYIIDETVEYYATDLNTIEVNLPSLSVDAGNLVNIPVKVITNGQHVGSLQLALGYDTSLLEFKGVLSEEKVGNWMSFINPNNGIIEWGGYDVSGDQHLLNDQEQVLTLQFLAKQPKDNWTQSPIYVTRKFAGDGIAKDMNITPTDGRVEVRKAELPSVPTIARDYATIKVNPNPTTGVVMVEFSVPNQASTSVVFYDLYGIRKYVVVESTMPAGIYNYKADISNLSRGIYNAVLKTGDITVSNKTILN